MTGNVSTRRRLLTKLNIAIGAVQRAQDGLDVDGDVLADFGYALRQIQIARQNLLYVVREIAAMNPVDSESTET